MTLPLVISDHLITEIIGSFSGAGYRVFCPIRRGPVHAFDFLTGKTAHLVYLSYSRSELSPLKELLMPFDEPVLECRLNNGHAEFSQPEIDYPPTIVFGVHPYDVHALATLDAVMLGGDAPDPLYAARRERTVVICLDVERPADDAFAASLGTHSIDTGFDIRLTRIGSRYLVDVATATGQEVWSTLTSDQFKTPATAADIASAQQNRENAAHQYARTVSLPPNGFVGADFVNLMRTSAAAAGHCVGCSACTQVCPTCTCFELYQTSELNGMASATRRRHASCISCGFALVTGGHNFREGIAERQHHRYARKTLNMQHMHGALGCVGCGRCTSACHARDENGIPVASISHVFERMALAYAQNEGETHEHGKK